jgi:hypothetical protein
MLLEDPKQTAASNGDITSRTAIISGVTVEEGVAGAGRLTSFQKDQVYVSLNSPQRLNKDM